MSLQLLVTLSSKMKENKHVHDSQEYFKEYKVGSAGIAHQYLQRFGVPGKYTYIYPDRRFEKLGRKTSFIYKRFLRKARRFLNAIKMSYDAQSMNVKPKTWHSAIVNIRKKDGINVMLHVNLKSHQIYSYRSSRGKSGGASGILAKRRKQGILRYR